MPSDNQVKSLTLDSQIVDWSNGKAGMYSTQNDRSLLTRNSGWTRREGNYGHAQR